MKIQRKEITIKQLTADFSDNDEKGVFAYGGKLDVRPPYQREFIYKDKQRDLVIDSVRNGYPLNVMYWAVREDGHFEVIDGQQRTLSICKYVACEFSIDGLAFDNLKADQQKQILDYKLMVYQCSGTDSERLKWFETINIAGEKLEQQELLNAVYAGPWTASAKTFFSKNGCAAYGLAKDYLSGQLIPIRQDYLEVALKWYTGGGIEEIKKYMSEHQHNKSATPLWRYFQQVIAWVKATFPVWRKEMKAVNWGDLYNRFKDQKVDTDDLAEKVTRLMLDVDVERKPGIYPYVLDGDERHLNIRAFDHNDKREAFERQKGICPKCQKKFEFEDMEGDHVNPWHLGGKTIAANCQMLCKEDNRRKSGK